MLMKSFPCFVLSSASRHGNSLARVGKEPAGHYKEFANNLCVFITLFSLFLLLRPLGSSKLFTLHMPQVGKADKKK
jgi:hypothetical protein